MARFVICHGCGLWSLTALKKKSISYTGNASINVELCGGCFKKQFTVREGRLA